MKLQELIIGAVLILLISGCAEDSPEVWLELTPIGKISHQVYVDIMLTFHNDTDEEIAIYRSSRHRAVAASMDNFLSFEIEKDDGTDLTFKPGREDWAMPQAEDRVAIAPGGRYAEKINLARFYVEPDRVSEDIDQPWQTWPLRIWEQGEYEVRCVYEYTRDTSWTGGEGLWEGRLTSDEVTIKVGSSGIPWGVFQPPPAWDGHSETPK